MTTNQEMKRIFADCAGKASQLLDFFEPPVQRTAILSLLMAASATVVSDALGQDTEETRRLIAEIAVDSLQRMETLVQNYQENGELPFDRGETLWGNE